MDLKFKNSQTYRLVFTFFISHINVASDSDNNCEVLLAGRQYPSIEEFASVIPNQLLLGSLLEHLCFVYEHDPTRSRMLFKGRLTLILIFLLFVLQFFTFAKTLNQIINSLTQFVKQLTLSAKPLTRSGSLDTVCRSHSLFLQNSKHILS